MRFGTRTFLWSFVPFALLLLASFWAIQTEVVSTVRTGLRSSLHDQQVSIARIQARSELQNSRFLRVLGEDATLKAGIQLLSSNPKSAEARLTVEDQLREISGMLGFDFLLLSNADGTAIAGVMQVGSQFVGMDVAKIATPRRGFLNLGDQTYQVVSIPVDQGDEHIAMLSVGERFDFSEFTTPAVLTRNGRVILSNLQNASDSEVERALKACPDQSECELRVRGETYLSLPMNNIPFGDGYLLRSVQNVDSATAPVQSILRGVFVFAGVGALAAALILSIFSSRSIVNPILGIVGHLADCQRTGLLPEFPRSNTPIVEIRALMESFNRAAAAIRDGSDRLRRAYVEFIGSLASALDARDRYTAGHSHRVSEFSCAIARAMHLPETELDEIRVAALLHDIGKIGISDCVLQKAGKLTPEEFALIQQHTTIGRHILEGVHGFEPYLPVVELHHENWDGSGYPRGLRGDSTPLRARIVHVADVYDAITSDRPYRAGMTHEEAVALISECSGTQFDPAIVEAFVKSAPALGRKPLPERAEDPETKSIRQLADALQRESTVDIRTESSQA
ncbi:MAG TPA: HD domain-containing phosphohydrolase [Bryobacteraceae bacterium]|nr:HD domain-containing phosphohydrolase [Bryobacteraceae bacterium]